MKILVTGSNGFIGSQLVASLLISGYEVFVSDFSPDYRKSIKYIYPDDVVAHLHSMDIVVHLGAISETNSSNIVDIFQKNVNHTISILSNLKHKTKLIYASSAAVYGVDPSPLNRVGHGEVGNTMYARSKLTVDNIVRYFFDYKNIIGLRFFNVCSFMGEAHKRQPSPTFTFKNQLDTTGKVRLFKGSDSIYRDFIYINDVINIIRFCMELDEYSTRIVNVGTGCSVSFEMVADALLGHYPHGSKEYINHPPNLTDGYQSYTRADISPLRKMGYSNEIPNIIKCIEGLL